MPASTRTVQPGDIVAGRYRLDRQLGQGGMGAVFVATHTLTGRAFAIKVLNPELSGDAEAEARFFREAKLASSINHPTIVEVYDVGRDGDAPYMVMKLLSGETLAETLSRGPLHPEDAIAMLLPILDGVSAAHAVGIVHRDLKPENILLHRERDSVQPKVLDFGISKLLSPDARTKLTRTGVSLGTPLFMSPEQVRGEDNLDARVDVYALGVILYQMLSGALPYFANTYAELVLKIIQGNARPLRELNPAISPKLAAIVTRAMSPAREERQADAAELRRELALVRGGATSGDEARASHTPMRDTSTPFTAEARAAWQQPARKSARTYGLIAGAVVALGAVGAFLIPALDKPAGAERSAGAHAPALDAPTSKPANVLAPAPVVAAPEPKLTKPAPAVAPTPTVTAPNMDAPAAAQPVAEPAPAPPVELAAEPKPAGDEARERDEREQAERKARRRARVTASAAEPAAEAAPEPAPRRRMRSEIIDPFGE